MLENRKEKTCFCFAIFHFSIRKKIRMYNNNNSCGGWKIILQGKK
jgi:hypothetical protein